MSQNIELRSWSSLRQDEQTQLLFEYQPILDCETTTCSFAIKFERMQHWLLARGISITEDEIRKPGRPALLKSVEEERK